MKKNRRDFLKLLGLGAIAPIVPKINPEPTTTAPTLISGKIKTDGLLAHIENNKQSVEWRTDGPERFRIYSNASMMKMYEDALWQGNAITDDKTNNQNK
jgi:hypothetical protein